MSQLVHTDGEEQILRSCTSKAEREISIGSTMLPSSPLLSRNVSPGYEYESGVDMDAVEFQLGGLPDELLDDSSFDETIKEIQSQRATYPVGGLADEISKSYFQLKNVTCTSGVSKAGSDEFRVIGGHRAMTNQGAPLAYILMSFGFGVFSHYLYGTCISNTLVAFMTVLALFMTLPGIYLYVVDGCRPEDNDEDVDMKKSEEPPFWLRISGTVLVYALWTSCFFRSCMGILAVLMLMPGIYLYAVEGCRPEDCEDD